MTLLKSSRVYPSFTRALMRFLLSAAVCLNFVPAFSLRYSITSRTILVLFSLFSLLSLLFIRFCVFFVSFCCRFSVVSVSFFVSFLLSFLCILESLKPLITKGFRRLFSVFFPVFFPVAFFERALNYKS